jgi:glycosyltransferase involved in cell wall biosynthesis
MVVVVGQTPPPVNGQSVAIQSFLEGMYEKIELRHVPMTFSRNVAEIGRFRVRKLLQLPLLVARVLGARLRQGGQVLYYPPSPAQTVPFLRDAAVLLCSRWAFRHTVFHLHSGGMAEAYQRRGRLGRFVFRAAYSRPDVVVALWPGGSEGALLRAKRQVVVAYGVPDDAAARLASPRPRNQVPLLLYVGAVRESKGVLVLLEACGALRSAGVPFRLQLVGESQPATFHLEVRSRVAALGLEECVELVGPLTGPEKWTRLHGAEVFCFPSFFEHENLPLAVIEAMEFALPVVATRWRGIPSLVVDGETGYLVDVGDSAALAERVATLLRDAELRSSMGAAARRRYVARYGVDRYRAALEDAIVAAVAE